MGYSTYRIGWHRGAIYGILAFVVGFSLTWHFIGLGTVPRTAYNTSETTLAGWFYYNAQTVPLTETASFFGEDASQTGLNLINTGDASPYHKFLYLLPPGTLLFAGVLSAAAWGKTRTLSYAALNGASITVGYIVVIIGGIFFFSATESTFGATGTLRPSFLYSVIVAGLVYPLLFGSIGGLLYFFSQGRVSVTIGR